MPTPTPRDVHIERPLTAFSIAFRPEGFIATEVFPVVRVSNQSDVYFIYGQEAWFQVRVGTRAPGSEAPLIDYTVSTGTYLCKPYAVAKAVPDETRWNADNPLQPDRDATELVTVQLTLALEKRVADVVFNTSNWDTTATPSTKWDQDTADPFGDIDGIVYNVAANIGRMPNTIVFGARAWRYFRQHPDVLDRIKYTRAGGRVNTDDVKDWWGFDKVLIGQAVIDTGQEGAPASSKTFVWDNDVWVGWVPARPALMTPAAGYVLRWRDREIRRFRDERRRQDIIEGTEYTDEVVTSSAAGGLLYDVVT